MSLGHKSMDSENTRLVAGAKPAAAPAPAPPGAAGRAPAGARQAVGALQPATHTNRGAAAPAMGGAARPSSSYSSSSLGGGAAPVAAAGHSHSDRMDTSSDASMAMGMLHHGAGSVAGMPFGADIVMLPAIPQGVADVDKDDKADPACVADYAREIHAHQRSEEASKSAKYGYMAHQTDINEKMRAILLDWLEEVHVKFKLMPETLYLTANLIDRFLEKKIVIRSKLQLVGVTAMLIASKYEEIYAPEVRDFVYITDKAYTREQILAMEATMLNTLDFKVSVPTVLVFLNRYLKIAGAGNDEKLTRYATFLVERQVQEYRMLQHAPSKIAASAVNMALRTLRPTVRGVSVWNPTLEFHTGYTERDLRPTILDMQEVMAASVTSSLQAVRKKYSNPKFGEVAGIPLALLE